MRRKIYLLLLLVGLFSSMNAQDYRFSGSGISVKTKERNMVYLCRTQIRKDIPLYFYKNNRCMVNCKKYKKVESFGEIAKGDLLDEYELTYENGLLNTVRLTMSGSVYRLIFNEQKYLTDVYEYNSSGSELGHYKLNNEHVAYFNGDYYVGNNESAYLFEEQRTFDGKYGKFKSAVLYHVCQNQIRCSISLTRWTKLNAKGRFNDKVRSHWQRGYWEQYDNGYITTYQFIRDGFYIQFSGYIYDYEEQIF